MGMPALKTPPARRSIARPFLMFYTVLWIHYSDPIYRGTSERQAATMLNMGTCYGKGLTQGEADSNAAKWQRHFANLACRV